MTTVSQPYTFACDQFLANPGNLCHVLMLNAGIMMGPPRLSTDGFDLQLATNFLGHVHLVNRLRDRLVQSQPSRIIHLSSIAARFGAVHWDDINCNSQGPEKYNSMKASRAGTC
jgi:NAD(P)-dependent dehydrogenase (short-subunit alcohol dehydrogenase family)